MTNLSSRPPFVRFYSGAQVPARIHFTVPSNSKSNSSCWPPRTTSSSTFNSRSSVLPSNLSFSCWRTSACTKSHLRSSAIRVQLAPARDTIRISLQIAFTPDFILARQFLHEIPSFAFLCNCNPSSPSPCWRTRSGSRKNTRPSAIPHWSSSC